MSHQIKQLSGDSGNRISTVGGGKEVRTTTSKARPMAEKGFISTISNAYMICSSLSARKATIFNFLKLNATTSMPEVWPIEIDLKFMESVGRELNSIGRFMDSAVNLINKSIIDRKHMLFLEMEDFCKIELMSSVDETIFEEFYFKALFVADSPSLVHLYEALRRPYGLGLESTM